MPECLSQEEMRDADATTATRLRSISECNAQPPFYPAEDTIIVWKLDRLARSMPVSFLSDEQRRRTAACTDVTEEVA